MRTYKGKYKIKNPEKYRGDHTNVVFRSLWERQVMRFMDSNSDIVKWNSEETVVPYICETDRRPHRYFLDFWYKTKDGEEFIVEVKPKVQTIPPKKPTRKTKKYITECLTYVKNQSKWKAAKKYADKRGMNFQIWHEDIIKGLGIKI